MKRMLINGTLVLLALFIVLSSVIYFGNWGTRFNRIKKWQNRIIAQIYNVGPEDIIPQAHAEAAKLTRIWPIGDSITEGMSGRSSYRYWLWKMLKDSGAKVEFVGTKSGNIDGSLPHTDFDQHHNAYTAYRADDVVPIIARVCNQVDADIALVHLGTNDLGYGETPQQIVGDIEQLVAVLRARNPQIKILLAEIIPAAYDSRIFAELNQKLREYAKRADTPQSRVIAVDHFTGFDPALHNYDGLHPSAEGEQLIARRWFEALQPHLGD